MPNDSVDALAARVGILEGQVREIFERLNDKDSGLTVLSAKLNNILVTLGEVKQAVTTLQAAPAKKWEGLVMAVIGALISAVVGFVAAKI